MIAKPSILVQTPIKFSKTNQFMLVLRLTILYKKALEKFSFLRLINLDNRFIGLIKTLPK